MNSNYYDRAGVLGLLRRRVREAGSQSAFRRHVAEQYGIHISATYLSELLSDENDRMPGELIFKALRLRQIVRFEPMDDFDDWRPKREAAHAP